VSYISDIIRENLFGRFVGAPFFVYYYNAVVVRVWTPRDFAFLSWEPVARRSFVRDLFADCFVRIVHDPHTDFPREPTIAFLVVTRIFIRPVGPILLEHERLIFLSSIL